MTKTRKSNKGFGKRKSSLSHRKRNRMTFKKGGGFFSNMSMSNFNPMSSSSGPSTNQPATVGFNFENSFDIIRKSAGQPVYREECQIRGNGKQITIDFSVATNTARCLGLGLAIRKGIIFFISTITNNDSAAIKYASAHMKLNKDRVCISTNNKIVLTYDRNSVTEFTLNGESLIAGTIQSNKDINELLKQYHDSLVLKGKLFDSNGNKLTNQVSQSADADAAAAGEGSAN